MRVLWSAAKEAKKHAGLLIIAALSTLALTLLNLYAPRILTQLVSIVEVGVTEETLKTIINLALFLLGIYLLRVVFRYLSNFLAHKAAWTLVGDVRIKVYDHMQSLSIGYFQNRQTGELMSRVVNDTTDFELLYAHLIPETITNVATLIGVTAILFSMNPTLALLTCIPIPLILISGWFLVKKVRPNFRRRQRDLAELNAQLQDNFSGMQEIQAFRQEATEVENIREKAERYTDSQLKALNLNAIFHPSVEFLTSLGTVIVVGVGGYLAYLGQISVSTIVAFLLYLSLFYAPVTSLAQLLENAQQAISGVERVMEVLNTDSDIVEKKNAITLKDIKGEIKFEQVSFSYVEDTPILKDISFDIKPGEMVALVGPTGVGKTTLIQLATRFYDPTEGKITIDGHDLKDVKLDSIREQVSLVLQDTFLFNGTVAENIAYAKPGASMDEIMAAAKVACVHDDIMEMPQGYDTHVGERGSRVSGGQKQRISIARAILRNSPILILDEATAAIDVETEVKIQDAIENLAGKRTVITIAHRLSTVRQADQIFVFEEGEITQHGTHDELIAVEGLYQRMCRIQEKGAQLSMGDIA
ncbi:MAG: ABC transporter ATP-binding protein [Christensenellaceae bacterium]